MTEADRIICWQMARALNIPDKHIEILIGLVCEDDEDATYPIELMHQFCLIYARQDPALKEIITKVEAEQAVASKLPKWLQTILGRIQKSK